MRSEPSEGAPGLGGSRSQCPGRARRARACDPGGLPGGSGIRQAAPRGRGRAESCLRRGLPHGAHRRAADPHDPQRGSADPVRPLAASSRSNSPARYRWWISAATWNGRAGACQPWKSITIGSPRCMVIRVEVPFERSRRPSRRTTTTAPDQ
ncbi:hypothetical protein KPaMU14_03230 [Kocuria palustris]|nr:hypothetical protein KPaMU14_03230 [Kocuria palustris]